MAKNSTQEKYAIAILAAFLSSFFVGYTINALANDSWKCGGLGDTTSCSQWYPTILGLYLCLIFAISVVKFGFGNITGKKYYIFIALPVILGLLERDTAALVMLSVLLSTMLGLLIRLIRLRLVKHQP